MDVIIKYYQNYRKAMSLDSKHKSKVSENDQTFEVTETPRSFSPMHLNNMKQITKQEFSANKKIDNDQDDLDRILN